MNDLTLGDFGRYAELDAHNPGRSYSIAAGYERARIFSRRGRRRYGASHYFSNIPG